MRYFPNHQPQALELTEVSMVLGVPWTAKLFPVQWNSKVHIEKRHFIMLYYVVLLNSGCMKGQLLESRSLDSYSKVGYAAFCVGQWE